MTKENISTDQVSLQSFETVDQPVVDVHRYGSEFSMNDEFFDDYRGRTVPWGYGDLSHVTFKRTYARKKDDGTTEQWWETCRRVVEGVFTVQKTHCAARGLPWNEAKARDHARRMYDRLFHFKWTPPGRGLWQMGTDFAFEETAAGANNCGFHSTKNVDQNYAEPFVWSFNMSMLGVGVGFDTKGKETDVVIQEPEVVDETHTVDDSREGWARALERLLNAFVGTDTLPKNWDFSEIRSKGEEIESFGGTASGPAPLKDMLESLESLYAQYIGSSIDAELIVDTFNIAGKCVVSGGTRRSAQIALGDPDDDQFLDLKEDEEKKREYRWASNNSVIVEEGQEYGHIGKRTKNNGEPGYFWLETAQKYGRLKDDPNWDDRSAEGTNPCGEQTLESGELCTLVETYPAHHDSLEEFKETLKSAYMYAKTVTLMPTHSQKTNAIMFKNRRIGCSMTGIVQAINCHGYRNFLDWCDESYEYIQSLDDTYSEWLCVPRSIKTTSVKPSGTVSTLAGSTPGVHWDHSPYYIRRMRIEEDQDVLDLCKEAGYAIKDDPYAPNTKVVEFPIRVESIDRGKKEVSVYEKVDLAAKMQKYWADNQVSCTAEFDPEEEAEDIPRLLKMYEDQLKSISFLPTEDHGYDLPPFEEISVEEYWSRLRGIDPIHCKEAEDVIEPDLEDEFCDSKRCEIENISRD